MADPSHLPASHAPLDAGELGAWLRLCEAPGIGPVAVRALLDAFGLPEAILCAPRDRVADVVGPALARALAGPGDATHDALVARTIAWNREPDHHVVTLADARYPAALLEIADPPPLLYVHGRVDRLSSTCLSIVGSRDATPQGRVDARRMGKAIASAGLTVVSGLALGIDAAAHEGALDAGSEGASTIAVIGTGPDLVYPASHRDLAHRIARHGALVGEFALGTRVAAHRFPRRNRIIAGLAQGVLVVEAASRSGSLITARLAADAGRDVFAIPGSIHSPQSKGCHALIRQGATLVETVDDVLDEYGRGSRPSTVEPPPVSTRDDAVAAAILDAIGHAPASIDDIADRSREPVARIASILLDLELAGRVARLPGGRVQRLIA